jgi:glycosyltransferase involved in cell wall biosynthesis
MTQSSKGNPQVTVLMAVYNGERYLREAIDSVFAQTFADFELLIINDGSTDGTAAILEDYDDPRTRVVSHGKNIGLTRSLNEGLHLARGKYVARMDADDVSLPERLRLQARYLDEHPDVGLLSTAYEIVDDDGTSLEIVSYRWGPEAIYYQLQFCNFTVGPDTMFRTDLALKIGGYDETCKRAQDYDLWSRLSLVTKIDHLPTILVVYRSHRHNITHIYREEQSAYTRAIFLKHMRNLMDNSINVAETLCFHDVTSHNRDFSITYHSLSVLELIHERLLEEYPKGLRRVEIAKQCDYTLGRYVALMILNVQTRDVVRAFLNPRYRRSLLFFVGRKLTANR